MVWDVTADFDANNNPTSEWSYGWKNTVGGAFTLYTLKGNSFESAVNNNWRVNNGGREIPGIVKNESGGVYDGVPDGWMTIHPGPDL